MFAALGRQERRLLLQAVLWLPLFKLGLWLFGFARFYTFIKQRPAQVSPRTRHNVWEAQRIAKKTAVAVHRAAQHGFVQATCLPRSLLLFWLLQRQNLAATLIIGVHKHKRPLAAHAWVEFQGAALNEPANIYEQFTPLAGLSAMLDKWNLLLDTS